MAELDDLIAQIADEGLRSQVKAGVDSLTRQMRFGLVFERHLPESIRAYNAPIRVGDTVQVRAELVNGSDYVVDSINRRTARVTPVGGGDELTFSPRELVGVKRFGEPVFPALNPIDAVRRSDDRSSHSVICGENYHALQLLRYMYKGKIDCIYIDPPYNTGSSDWKYNNRYVDGTDRWRHSKWLSFMEKRLQIAAELLKPDGVLVVTIDEHEVHHLGVLLEQVFRGYLLHTVSVVMNPKEPESSISRESTSTPSSASLMSERTSLRGFPSRRPTRWSALGRESIRTKTTIPTSWKVMTRLTMTMTLATLTR